jgi:hypothetical protein
MPKPIALISSSDIQGQAFIDVVREVGGAIEDAKALQGRISQGERHVWAPSIIACSMSMRQMKSS